MNEIGKSGAHRTFLLRAWREGAGERSWRFSLEDPATRARQGFDGIEGLMTFLDEACPKDAGTQGDPPAATGSRTGRTGRRTRGALPLALAALLSLLSAPLLRAAPPDGPGLLAIGTVVAPPGGLAILPIHARTGGSVPLESISVKVALEPASAVASATFRKSPAAEGRRTIFEARPQATGSSSWLLVLDGPIAPAGPADPEGILVGRLELRLDPSVPRGTTILVRLDPVASALGNRGGTALQSAADGSLLLVDGAVTVGRPAGEPQVR